MINTKLDNVSFWTQVDNNHDHNDDDSNVDVIVIILINTSFIALIKSYKLFTHDTFTTSNQNP